jgi:hypothetical protein
MLSGECRRGRQEREAIPVGNVSRLAPRYYGHPDRPNIIILAGPNEAAKTTASRSLLVGALAVQKFVNCGCYCLGQSSFRAGSCWSACDTGPRSAPMSPLKPLLRAAVSPHGSKGSWRMATHFVSFFSGCLRRIWPWRGCGNLLYWAAMTCPPACRQLALFTTTLVRGEQAQLSTNLCAKLIAKQCASIAATGIPWCSGRMEKLWKFQPTSSKIFPPSDANFSTITDRTVS